MKRRLYRSRRDSILGGVAGGVADYLDVDPSIVRIVWAVLALLTGGLFLVLYIVMWIVVPLDPITAMAPAPGAAPGPPAAAPGEPATDTAAGDAAPAWQGWVDERRVRRGGSGGAVIFGLILIGVGIWFLVDRYVPAFDPDLVWPVVLVVLGAALLIVSLRRPRVE
jgi:phage shock protein PspC (stress-responsive transcriptional regulator)